MLILSRKFGESLTLTLPDGRVIEVKYCGMHGSGIRLGIEAPRDVKVMRPEVSVTRIDYEKRGVRQ